MSDEERKALLDAVLTVGRWAAVETQKRKYPSEQVQMLSDSLVLLKAHFEGKVKEEQK